MREESPIEPKLTPEQAEWAQKEAALQQAVELPMDYAAVPILLADGTQGVLVAVRTPAGTARIVFRRDDGLALASAIRKTLHGGLVVPG